MDFKNFTAGENDDGRRLDRILRIFLPDSPLSEIYSLIRKGLIKVNGKKAKSNDRVNAGDQIQIATVIIEKQNANALHEEKASGQNKMQSSEKMFDDKKTPDGKKYTQTGKNNAFHLPYEIRFQNKNLLILEKPYGVCVHGKEKSMDKNVKLYYEAEKAKNEEDYDSLSFSPGPLHRLDERTTGLIAFSWSLKGANWFSSHIKDHSIQKEYISIVVGKVEKSETWKDFIEKDSSSGITQGKGNAFHTVNARSAAGEKTTNFQSEKNSEKLALTEIHPVKVFEFQGKELSLVRFVIHTGRTHQIRSQSALHSHPLFGDSAYGGDKYFSGPRNNNERNPEFFLHAFRLTFPENPVGLPEKLISPLPEHFKHFLASCNCEIDTLSL